MLEDAHFFLLNKSIRSSRLTGYRISRNGLAIANLLFADDSITFCRATRSESMKLLRILSKYGELSSQAVNLSKSNVMFSSNTLGMMRMQLANPMGEKHTGMLGKYLGLEVEFGLSKKAVFENIKSKSDF